MSNVAPFKALHYNPKTFADLSAVITPPYDNIPKGFAQTLLDRSPYNFAHLDLPKSGGDDYSASRELIHKWLEKEILVRDPHPSYYLYRQTFKIDATEHVRDTLMCAVKLSDFKEGHVRPHENTFGHAKADRLRQLRGTQCNQSHIFGMVKDREGTLETVFERWEFEAPLVRGKSDDGSDHTLWKMEASRAPEIARFFETHPVYIVDGHHRYESSLAYARELGVVGTDHPAAYTLFAIATVFDPALVCLPTHRVVADAKPDRAEIEKSFTLTPVDEPVLLDFVGREQNTARFGLSLHGNLYLCEPRTSEESFEGSLNTLAVVWSDWVLLKRYCGINDTNRETKVTYEKDAKKLLTDRDRAHVVVFHAPPPIEAVTKVADDGQFLPQKTTYFYPKLAAGLVLRELTPE